MALREDIPEDTDLLWSIDTRDEDYVEFAGVERWVSTYPAASVANYELIGFGAHLPPSAVEAIGELSRQIARVLSDSGVYDVALKLLLRAETMGLTSKIADYAALQAPLIDALSALHSVEIGRDVTSRLLRARADASAWRHALTVLLDRMEWSPAPDREWPFLRRIFDDVLLASLVGVRDSDIPLYANSEQRTPDEVAVRMHYLSLIVADLATAYNDYGIRRWFTRRRTQLDGRSPSEILSERWNPDDGAAQSVRRLAQQLLGAQAT